jgi:hypothetical protein
MDGLKASVRSRSLIHVCEHCHAPLPITVKWAFLVPVGIMAYLIAWGGLYLIGPTSRWDGIIAALVMVTITAMVFSFLHRVTAPNPDGTKRSLFQAGWTRFRQGFQADVPPMFLRHHLERLRARVTGGMVSREQVPQVMAWIERMEHEHRTPTSASTPG